MKKLLVLIMTLVMTLSLAACGGGSTEAGFTETGSTEAGFTEEQQTLAQDFLEMSEAFDVITSYSIHYTKLYETSVIISTNSFFIINSSIFDWFI